MAGASAPLRVTGWDLAGVLERAAADGSGPATGTRVVGLVRKGAWARLAAVPTGRLAPLPDSVSDTHAAALPTAGMTALRSLEVGGLLLAKRVAVTGATGGVGRFAVALADAAGARGHGAGAGCRRGGLDAAEARRSRGGRPVDRGLRPDRGRGGGAVFGQAIEHLAARGVVVNLATRDGSETVTFLAARFDRSPGARIYTLNLFDELAAPGSGTRELTRLVSLVAGGRLDGQVDLEASWRSPGPALDALVGRKIGGKVVLHLD